MRYICNNQIAHYNHIKDSSKRPDPFKNCIVRFRIFMMPLKVYLPEPNSSKGVRDKPLIFLNSTLIQKFC